MIDLTLFGTVYSDSDIYMEHFDSLWAFEPILINQPMADHFVRRCCPAIFHCPKLKYHKSYEVQTFSIITQSVKMHMHVSRV